jgi:hypothetical protein
VCDGYTDSCCVIAQPLVPEKNAHWTRYRLVALAARRANWAVEIPSCSARPKAVERIPCREELLSSIFGGVAGQHDAAAHQVDSAAAASTTPGALAFKTAPAPVAARARVPAVAALPVEPPEPLEWGGHTAASTFKPSQLSRLCREIGASTEQMDACADADDPKAEYMALLRPSRLQRRCAGLGTYSEAEMEACADAEAPQLAYIRLLLQER